MIALGGFAGSSTATVGGMAYRDGASKGLTSSQAHHVQAFAQEPPDAP